MNALLAVVAVALGFVLTTQVATNKQLGESLGNMFIPSAVNMAVGFVCTCILTVAVTRTWPGRSEIQSAPWYGWLAGGVLGCIYLTGNILLAPKLGAAALVSLVVAGQLVWSVTLDHFAWIGFERHPASALRLVGVGLLAGGAFLIARF